MPNNELEKQVEQFEEDLKSGKKKEKKASWKYILNISLVLIVDGLFSINLIILCITNSFILIYFLR